MPIGSSASRIALLRLRLISRSQGRRRGGNRLLNGNVATSKRRSAIHHPVPAAFANLRFHLRESTRVWWSSPGPPPPPSSCGPPPPSQASQVLRGRGVGSGGGWGSICCKAEWDLQSNPSSEFRASPLGCWSASRRRTPQRRAGPARWCSQLHLDVSACP